MSNSPVPTGVVDSYLRNSPRATKLICLAWGFTRQELIRNVKKSSKSWQKFKFCEKILFSLLFLRGEQFFLRDSSDAALARKIKQELHPYIKKWDEEQWSTCPRFETLMQYLDGTSSTGIELLKKARKGLDRNQF